MNTTSGVKHLIFACSMFLLSITTYHLIHQHWKITHNAKQATKYLERTSWPSCRNTIVFSGARQGSTWFVNSIEKCAYTTSISTSITGTYNDNVFDKTELWKHFGEPDIDGTSLSATDALKYIVSNSSIKIFPSVFYRRKKDIAFMLSKRKKFDVSVTILRRNVHAAWKSWLKARGSKVWRASNGNCNEGPGSREEEDDDVNTTKTSNTATATKTGKYVQNHTNGDKQEKEKQMEMEMDISIQGEEEGEGYLRKLYKIGNEEDPNNTTLDNGYDEYRKYFFESRQRYDAAVEKLLKENQVPFDIFDYDEIRHQPIILARNNKCWIANCNFEEMGK